MLDVRSISSPGSSSRCRSGQALLQSAASRVSIKGCTSRRARRALADPQHTYSAIKQVSHGKYGIPVCSAASGSAIDTTAQAEASETDDQGSVLQELLVWLVNNGVTGIGLNDSQVALYQDTDGDRGIIAVEDIASGRQLVRVPLRLAITDVMDEQQKSQLVKQGSYWQDRLVAKLLHEVQQGRQSAWYPYIRALPNSVPSALESFSRSDAQQVQLPAVCATIQGHTEKISASWQACRPDAISGADLQTYRWAHSCVMSRTFGNAAHTGGIGVHMMVPLIDMLNHAGDETDSGLLSDAPVARDNVRWDVVSPENSPNNCWEMVLSSTQLIPAETPLLLSYFEGSNDEFLLHYGFVPASNPHDSMQLFSNITEALEYLWWKDLAQGKAAADLAAGYKQALDAGVDALQQEVAAAAAGSDDSSNWGQLLDTLEPIKVASGSRVSNPLVAALEVIHAGDMPAVEAEIACLAWQQLQAMPTSLLHDLALLVTDAVQTADEEAIQRYSGLLHHYAQSLLPDYEPQLCQQLTAAAAAGGNSDSSSSSSSSSNTPQVAAIAANTKRKRAVPGPASVLAAPGSSSKELWNDVEQISSDWKSLASSLLQSGSLMPHQHVQQDGHILSPAVRCAVKFRVSKKMLLVDVVLAARPPLGVLQQQRQYAEKAASLRAEHVGESDVLPWQQ